MDIWHYHPTTGEFMGSGKADVDPMTPGAWLIPANVTLAPVPPYPPPPKRAWVYSGTEWVSAPDHRGETWWTAYGTPVVITGLGDPAAEGLLAEQPPPPPEPEKVEQTSAPPQPRRVVQALGSTFAYPDLGKLGIALSLANAAITIGVQAGDLRWHGGKTDFTWPDVNGEPVPMDAPGLILFAQAVHNT